MKPSNVISALFMLAIFYGEAEARVGVGFGVWDTNEETVRSLQLIGNSGSGIVLMDFGISRVASDDDGVKDSRHVISVGMGLGSVLAEDEESNVAIGVRAVIDWYRTAWDYGRYGSGSGHDVDVGLGPFVRGEYFVGDRFSIAGISNLMLGFPGNGTDINSLHVVNSVSLTWHLGD
jgi:hypothetical protein